MPPPPSPSKLPYRDRYGRFARKGAGRRVPPRIQRDKVGHFEAHKRRSPKVAARKGGGRSGASKNRRGSRVVKKSALKKSYPSKKTFKSPFRKYTQRLPSRGKTLIYAIALVRIYPNAANEKIVQLPILVGRMTRKQAKAATQEDIESALVNTVRAESQLISVQGLVSLKPREKRKGVRVFKDKKNGRTKSNSEKGDTSRALSRKRNRRNKGRRGTA